MINLIIPAGCPQLTAGGAACWLVVERCYLMGSIPRVARGHTVPQPCAHLSNTSISLMWVLCVFLFSSQIG